MCRAQPVEGELGEKYQERYKVESDQRDLARGFCQDVCRGQNVLISLAMLCVGGLCAADMEVYGEEVPFFVDSVGGITTFLV